MENSYISNISFKVSSERVDYGHNLILQDLNKGSRGYYIYMRKEWTSSPNQAVTGFAFTHCDAPSGYTRLNQDLNQGAGGTYNYLCIKKDPMAPKITDITVFSFDHRIMSDTWDGWKVFLQDLNTGAKKVGRYIYLAYRVENPLHIHVGISRTWMLMM